MICISDNGAFMLPERGREVQSNKPLRDGGVTTYEGGVRVPAIFRWPGRLAPGTTCREMLSSLDVLPLILGASGGKWPTDRLLDGHDPTATLAGERPSPHDALFWVWQQGRNQHWRGMRRGNYKLVRRADAEPWQLYDLGTDLGEQHDLAQNKADVVLAMKAKYDRWLSAANYDPTRGKSTRAD